MKETRSKIFSVSCIPYDFVRLTALVPGLIFYRPKYIYENKEAKKRIHSGLLIISNHICFFDPIYDMYAIWYRRQRFICLKQFFDNKFSAFIFSCFRCIPIDRENFGIDTFREITEILKNGHAVTIFPEGQIKTEDSSGAFKSGMVLMALKSKVPVQPVYVAPKKHWYSRLKLVIGEPVDIVKMYGDKPKFSQVNEATKLLFEKEAKLKLLCEKGTNYEN